MKTVQFGVENQDPLSSARALLQNLWLTESLEGLYISVWPEDSVIPEGTLCNDPSQLTQADPFAPVMPKNQAPYAFQAVRDHPKARIGVFLRPCEWRTFRTLAGQGRSPGSDLFTISADCTGAMNEEDFIQLSNGAPRDLTRQVLHFASQGGILPSRRQSSCQLCEDPFPVEVDLQFELFGVPTDEQLVLKFRDSTAADAVAEKGLGSSVPISSVERRERVLIDLARWRASHFEKRKAQIRTADLSIQALAKHLGSCTACQEALRRHCPLMDIEMLSNSVPQDLAAVRAWLDSCSGCGVCERNCPDDYPLFDVIYSLRSKL